MSSSLLTSVRTQFGKTKRGTAFIAGHIFEFNIGAFVLMLALIVFYIVEVNSVVAQGYVQRDLEAHIQELTARNQQLEGETRSVQSLDHVSGAVQLLGLVPSEQPLYIKSVSLPH